MLNKAALITKYNDPTTGVFRDGQTAGISASDERILVQDLIDNLVHRDDIISPTNAPNILDGTGSTIVWDCGNAIIKTSEVVTNLTIQTLSIINTIPGGKYEIHIRKTNAAQLVLSLASTPALVFNDYAQNIGNVLIGGGANTELRLQFNHMGTLVPPIGFYIIDMTPRRGNALTLLGEWDFSSNTFPETGGTGIAGAIMKGDMFEISVAGTVPGGDLLPAGTNIFAKENSPGQNPAGWRLLF